MIRIEPAGAEALLLVLADQPDAQLAQRIARLAVLIRQQLGPLLVDLVPGWTSLLVHYDLLRVSHQQLQQQLTPLLEAWLGEAPQAVLGPLLELPIWYAGEDLLQVAATCDLSVSEVIALHSGKSLEPQAAVAAAPAKAKAAADQPGFFTRLFN